MFNFIVTQDIFITQVYEYAEYEEVDRFDVQAWSGSEAIAKAMSLAKDPSLGAFTYVQL